MELMIGRVIKSHGVKGEVVVEPTTDEPEVRFAIGKVLHGTQGKKEHALTVKAVRSHKGRLLILFEEVRDRTAADSLRGTKFRAAPLESDDGGFYDHELEGLRVVLGGKGIGDVSGVIHGGSQDLLEVKLDNGTEVLVPFVHAIVPEVDLAAGTCTIDPPEGLLDL